MQYGIIIYFKTLHKKNLNFIEPLYCNIKFLISFGTNSIGERKLHLQVYGEA